MFIQKAIRTVGIIAICVMMLIIAGSSAEAADQEVSLVPNGSAPAGKVYLDVQYDCADNSVTALGIRVHFDSAKLTYDGYDNVLSNGMLAPPQLQDDADNKDAYADTDKLILIGWQDMAGTWPNQTLPVNLVRLKFTPAGSDGTRLNITRVTNAAGFGFSGTGLSLSEPAPSPRRRRARSARQPRIPVAPSHPMAVLPSRRVAFVGAQARTPR